MKWISSLLLALFLMTIFTTQTYAIIFLPAVILIPISKLVALIIGGFSIPALGMGTLWSKFFHHSLRRVLFVVLLILVVTAMILSIIFKVYNPERSLF